MTYLNSFIHKNWNTKQKLYKKNIHEFLIFFSFFPSSTTKYQLISFDCKIILCILYHHKCCIESKKLKAKAKRKKKIKKKKKEKDRQTDRHYNICNIANNSSFCLIMCANVFAFDVSFLKTKNFISFSFPPF